MPRLRLEVPNGTKLAPISRWLIAFLPAIGYDVRGLL